MGHINKPRSPAKWAVGTHVRVQPGTSDPDFPDIPLGGWGGTIREVDQRAALPLYLIQWDQHTLDQMHPVYRERCERDGLELESMWLGEEDIGSDTDTVVVIEQPSNIRTRLLNEKDQDDRIRGILGLTSDDPLPEVDDRLLRKCHSYLADHLSFPFTAMSSEETGRRRISAQPLTVVGLLDSDVSDDIDGLFCEARQGNNRVDLPLAELEAKKDNPNCQLIEDYSYWLCNCG